MQLSENAGVCGKLLSSVSATFLESGATFDTQKNLKSLARIPLPAACYRCNHKKQDKTEEHIMKKSLAIVAALSLLLLAGLTATAENDAVPVTCPASCLISCPIAGLTATAEGDTAPTACPAGCTKAHFVDANGDGVCDSFADADNDGVCDGCGLRQGNRGQRGANFTDADGDGVCDLRAQRQGGRGQRQCARAQQGNRNGRGMNRHGR